MTKRAIGSGLRSILRSIARAAWICLAAFLLVSIILVALFRYVPPPATPLMLLRLAEGYGIEQSWRGFDHISLLLLKAVIAGEDQKFCLHRGFDGEAIEAAWERYESGHGKLYGASTISMQTAKNVFLWPGRDWLRKGLEAYFTTLIELAWGKQRILEVYLNVVEWGPGIYGVEAASEHYFKKSAAELTPEEAVHLAAVLPDPLGRSASQPGPEVSARSRFMVEQIPALPVWEPLPCGQPL